MLFILTGSVAVEAEGPDGCPVRLNLVKPGEILGEMAVLRDADARAADRRSARSRAPRLASRRRLGKGR